MYLFFIILHVFVSIDHCTGIAIYSLAFDVIKLCMYLNVYVRNRLSCRVEVQDQSTTFSAKRSVNLRILIIYFYLLQLRESRSSGYMLQFLPKIIKIKITHTLMTDTEKNVTLNAFFFVTYVSILRLN